VVSPGKSGGSCGLGRAFKSRTEPVQRLATTRALSCPRNSPSRALSISITVELSTES